MGRTLQRYVETYFVPEESRYGGPSVWVRLALVSNTTGEPPGPATIHFEGRLSSPRGLTLSLQGEVLVEDLLSWSRTHTPEVQLK